MVRRHVRPAAAPGGPGVMVFATGDKAAAAEAAGADSSAAGDLIAIAGGWDGLQRRGGHRRT
ncbi:hypothetical protein QJS66_20170 [Kocuria rhizophila]|nr:hypothetical protein QJS66_20170 [Kocuria rhizophila]